VSGYFVSVPAVEALCQEMLRPFNLNELRRHHGDVRCRGHVVFNLFGQFVEFWDDELLARVKSLLAARQELKRSHCSCSYE